MPLVGEPPGRQERDSPLTPCGAWLPLLTGYSNHTLKGQIWPFVFETSWQGVHPCRLAIGYLGRSTSYVPLSSMNTAVTWRFFPSTVI